MERINAGEAFDRGALRRLYPEFAERLIAELELYQGIEGEPCSEEPLGVLGDYTLRRRLGRGGMGTVYDAWQGSMDRRVALKVLPRALAADTRAATRFLREAQIAGKLDHPNVVRVHGTGVEEQLPYYAMDYVEGETLERILARIKDAEPETETPFGPKDQVDYFAKLGRAFADVADGLQHAHSKGVVHRDIKPSNLILDGEGRLRILDFGLARLEGQESLTLSGDLLGTPLYMSPEQARRTKIAVDHRTDVYSLGATMYEALAGRPPFRGKDHADTLSQIIERDPTEPRKMNPRAPKDLETIVLKCLRKDAGDRYGTAEALGQDLRRFVRGDPVEARPEGRWDLLKRRLRRHRVQLVAAAVFVILATALAWTHLERHRAEEERRLEAYPAAVAGAVSRLLVGRFSLEAGAERFRRRFLHASNLPSVLVLSVLASEEDLHEVFGDDARRTLEEAARELTVLAAEVPGQAEAHYYLGRALRLLGNEEGARRALDHALEVDPEFVPARFLRREMAMETAPPAGSGAGGASMAAAEEPGWRRWWLRAKEARSWSEAAGAYDRLIAFAEREEPYIGFAAEMRLERGAARLETGDHWRAIEDFSVASHLLPASLEPALLLGKTYLLAELPEQARATFERLHASRHPGGKDGVALWVSAVYSWLGQYEAALRWARSSPARSSRGSSVPPSSPLSVASTARSRRERRR